METEPEVTFNEAYRPLWEPLPASQRREAVKRLTTRRKDPIPVESLGEEHPDIYDCLTRLADAYGRKKQRCAAASARRRQAMKAAAVAEPAVVVAEVVAAPEPAVAEVVAECAVEPEPALEPESIPAPSRLRRRESAAIGSPQPRVPKPRVPKPTKPEPAPSQPEAAQPQPQKRATGGLIIARRGRSTPAGAAGASGSDKRCLLGRR